MQLSAKKYVTDNKSEQNIIDGQQRLTTFLVLIKQGLQKPKIRRATKPTKASVKRKAENKRKTSLKKSLRKKPSID